MGCKNRQHPPPHRLVQRMQVYMSAPKRTHAWHGYVPHHVPVTNFSFPALFFCLQSVHCRDSCALRPLDGPQHRMKHKNIETIRDSLICMFLPTGQGPIRTSSAALYNYWYIAPCVMYFFHTFPVARFEYLLPALPTSGFSSLHFVRGRGSGWSTSAAVCRRALAFPHHHG